MNNMFASIEGTKRFALRAQKDISKSFYNISQGGLHLSSVGLGLSIASDIARSHGGDIKFAKSKFGGLEVAISLPF